MLSLDDEDYEALGWGDAQTEYERPEWFQAAIFRARQIARAVKKYQQSLHGKRVAAALQKTSEPHRRAALKWSRNNPEAIKKNNAKFRAANPDYQRQYRARKKAERERQTRSEANRSDP